MYNEFVIVSERNVMKQLHERVAYLEGKVDEHSQGFGELRDSIRLVDGHVRALDDKLSRQFLWTVGIQIAVLLAVVGALARP